MTVPAQVTTWTASDVTALLRERVDSAVASCAWVGSGTWSDCFVFASKGRELVIRIGRFSADFDLDAFMGRCSSERLPIPLTNLVAPVGNEFFAISEFVPGRCLESVEPWDDIVPAAADLLEALRITDLDLPGWGRWSPTVGGEAKSWRSFLLAVNQDPPGTRISGWKAKLAKSRSATQAFDGGYELLQECIVDGVPRSVGHNDLLNRNVHVVGDSITGLFDWGNSILGDHLYDVATFCFWEPWLSQVRAQPLVDLLRNQWSGPEGVLQDFDDRLRTCMLHTALEHIAFHASQDHWDELQRIIERMNVVIGYRW